MSKYFVNITVSSKGSSIGGIKKGGMKAPLSEAEWANAFPQFERWYVAAFNEATGTYDLTNKDGSHTMRGVKNVSPRPAIVEIGNIANVGFYDCNRKKPYIWSFGRLLPDSMPIVPYVSDWRKMGRNYVGSFLTVFDDPEDESTATAFSGSVSTNKPYGGIIRANTSYIYLTDLGDVEVYSQVNGTFEDRYTISPDGRIIEFNFLGDTAHGLVMGYVSLITDYTAGYNAAVALFSPGGGFEGDPCSQGVFDCTNEEGYKALDLIAIYLAGDYAPPSGESEDYQNGWIDGFTSYYKSHYDACYSSEGCEVPEP